MNEIYCWKCKAFVPMLDDTEFQEFERVYIACVEAVKLYRKKHGASLEECPMNDLYKPAIKKYEELTGYRGSDPHHLLKHRVAEYGSPCGSCGKHLRSPQAEKCFECGQLKSA
jgi:hypothetical protein